MAGTARLTPGNAPTIPPPASSSNSAAREGFAYPNLAAISNFPMGASLDQQRRAVDHHHHNQQHHHHQQQQQQQQQQRQRELAMKRRIGEEIERERERERERLFERVRAERMVMERAARIAVPAGGGGRMFERDRVLAAAAERPIFADKRMDGPGILGNNVNFPVPGRIAEMHVGSSMHMENALDRGLENLELPKGLENPRGIELSRVAENPRGFDIPRGLENPGVLDIPRSMENPRMSEIPRGLDIPRSMENPRMLENARGMENPKGSENLRGLNPRVLETVSQNPRSLEMSRNHPRSWGNPELSREKPRSLENSRVLDKSRGLENTRSLDNPMASDRRLESGNTTGLDRRLDSIPAVERGLDATPDEGDSDRNGFKPSLRQASFERNRPTDWEREEDNSRDNDEKQKERPMDEAAIQELVAQYKTALAELTFNSKPIITNLTIIAGENLHASKAIASTVCNHILEVPVEQKLPSLYLLDSIVKNISSSYVKHFAARLPEVFIRSYRQVDPSLYPAMQHLFKTWRGVFTSEPLREIEAELQLNILGNGTSSYTAPPSNPTRLNDSPSPQQRSGHGIHVNPKYLEAQRQKLQQSSQPNDVPSRIERGDAVPPEVISGRKLASSLPEFDYGSLDRNEKGGTSVERKNAWDRGLPSREEDSVRVPESSSFRFGMRNGYELQQHSPRALIDAYGNIRGMRAPRLPPVLIQPAQELDSRNRGQARDWQNSEEEEYSWADISPRLLDVGESLRKEKDDWLHVGADKNLIPGSLTAARKSFGLDQPLSGHSGWARHGSWSGTDRPASAEDKSLRDIEERASLQDIGPRLDLDPLVEPPVIGPIGRPMAAHRPFAGRLPRPLTQQLSPSSQSRLRPLQVNRNTPPSVLGSTIGSEATNPGPNSSSGLTVTDPALASRSSVLPNLGSSFGGVNLNFESLSPVTPSGLNFQQRQHLKRPLSPPSLATSSEVHLPLPPLNPPLPNQHNLSSLQQHGFPSKSVQHQGQALDMHSHSSQKSVSLHPQQRPPPLIQQPPLKPSGVPQPPLLTAQLQQTAIEQIPDQPLPQIVPVQPQIPTHLLESLKQLQRHLPPLSEAAPQPSHPLQPPFLQNSSQPSKLTQSPQRSLGKVPILQGQQLPQTPALVGSVLNDNASALLSGPQSHVSTNHLLAAFLQIGLIPPQVSQMLSEPGVSSLVPPSEPTISQLTQAHPPLPSGPPPPSAGPNNLAGQSTLYAPAVSTLTSSLLTLAPLPLPPAVTSTRLVQPPLPPGPPPPSSQVASSVSQPAASAGSNLTSLLSSLMAQGMISAPSASIPPQSTGVASNVSMGLSFPNPSSNALLSGLEPSSRLPAPSTAVVSTTLVTALRNQEPTPKATSALTDEGLPSGLNVNEFKQELLRDRQESVIKALYSDFPRQCTTCGLRFKYQEEHSKHMDWHVSRNRRQKSSKKVSRKWFVSVKEWLDGTGAASSEVSPSFFADEVAEKPEEEEVLVAVPADENQIACALCGEPFEDFYSDDTEEWMYRGAVYMNVPGGSVEGLDSSVLGPIVHAKCRSESAAGTVADPTEDADLENEDDLGHSQKRTRF